MALTLKNRRGGRKNSNKQLRLIKKNKTSRNTNENRFVRLTDIGRFAPDRTMVRLLYQDTTLQRGRNSFDSANWFYQSSAYDPDPALGGGAIPGFLELANLYMRCCVHKMTMHMEIANQNAEAAVVVVWPSKLGNNTNSLSAADLAEYSGNVRATSKMLGSNSGINVVKLDCVASGMQLIGSRFKTDLDYSSSTSSNPTEHFVINCGIYGPAGNFGYLFPTRVRIIYDIEFFQLRQLES